MRLHSRSDIRDDTGQTMVEFALILPMLVVLLFAIVQFGIIYNHYVTLTDAVRAGARKAVVSRYLGPSAAQAACVNAVQSSASGLSTPPLTTTCTSSWNPGEDVVVTATYPWDIDLIGIPVVSGTLTSQTTERVE
jgi:Flp pilus assembly protein TadG